MKTVSPSRFLPTPFSCPIPALLPDLPPSPSPFADCLFLEEVIALLKRTRIQQNLGVESVARLARIRPRAIHQAEQDGVVPDSRQFKAWTAALGLCWERVWNDCLTGQAGLSRDRSLKHRSSQDSHRSRHA